MHLGIHYPRRSQITPEVAGDCTGMRADTTGRSFPQAEKLPVALQPVKRRGRFVMLNEQCRTEEPGHGEGETASVFFRRFVKQCGESLKLPRQCLMRFRMSRDLVTYEINEQ